MTAIVGMLQDIGTATRQVTTVPGSDSPSQTSSDGDGVASGRITAGQTDTAV